MACFNPWKGPLCCFFVGFSAKTEVEARARRAMVLRRERGAIAAEKCFLFGGGRWKFY